MLFDTWVLLAKNWLADWAAELQVSTAKSNTILYYNDTVLLEAARFSVSGNRERLGDPEDWKWHFRSVLIAMGRWSVPHFAIDSVLG